MKLSVHQAFFTRFLLTRLWRRVRVRSRMRSDFPSYWAIEFSAHCNRACPYCTNSNPEIRQKERQMPHDVFEATLRRFREIEYNGLLIYNYRNEPLLRQDFIPLVRTFTEALPESTHWTYTNGDNLDSGVMQQLVDAHLDKVIVTRHPPFNAQWDAKIDKLKKQFPLIDYRGSLLGQPWLLNFSGGVRVYDRHYVKRCNFFSYPVVVFYNGDVGLCSNLADREAVFGNVLKHSLKEVWDNPEYKRVREAAMRGEPVLDCCKKCMGRI